MSRNISRRAFLGNCAAAAAAASAMGGGRLTWGGPATTRKRPPNILLLSTDQWHARAFSHYGEKHVRTPNSDRILAGGVSFERSYAADPVCSPARTSWLTGRMPSEHRVIGNGFPILETMVDMGQWFGDRGYETAHFGKWHVPGRNPLKSFQRYAGMHPSGQFADLSVAQMARAYLLGRTAEKPFLLHVALMNPHDICQVSCMRTNAGRLPVDVGDLPPLPENFAARPGEPKTFIDKVRRSPNRAASFEWNDEDWRLYRWMYYRHCEEVDAAVGEVLDALEASGEMENTLLVYTSDHGEGLGHHGTFTKAFMYEESARVPLVMSMPGRLPAGTNDERTFVSGVDLFPTFCNLAGIEAPADLCGEDVLRQFESGKPARRHLVTHASFGGRMVRDERHKLIQYKDDPTLQLFDLADDPGETKNLAAERPAIVASLNEALAESEARLKPFPLPSGGLPELWRQYNKAGAKDEDAG